MGEAIRRIRLERDLSQEGLAELTNLHRTYIGAVERGERNIGIINLIKISRALKVTVSELLADVDKR